MRKNCPLQITFHYFENVIHYNYITITITITPGLSQMHHRGIFIQKYGNDSLFSDRHVCANTVQNQVRLLLEEQSDQSLHCLLFHLRLFFLENTLWFGIVVRILDRLQQSFLAFENLGTLRGVTLELHQNVLSKRGNMK